MSTDLAVIEAALAAATPGPWVAVEHSTIVQRREVMRDYLVAMIPNYSPETAANRDLIVLLRNTAAELVERVKAAEAEVERLEGVARKINWQLFDAGYHEAELLAENHAAEATIARVRELADSFEVEWPTGPDRDGATVAHLIRQALNHTDGISPESGTSWQRNRFTSANSAGANDTTLRARAEDATEPILRPTDQRYEPPAVDDCGGCCR